MQTAMWSEWQPEVTDLKHLRDSINDRTIRITCSPSLDILTSFLLHLKIYFDSLARSIIDMAIFASAKSQFQ